MKKKWLGFWFGAIVALVGLQACGSLESLFISADDERAMGDTFNMMVEARDPNLLQSGEALFVPKTAGDSAFYDYFDSLGRLAASKIDADDWKDLLATGTTEKNFFSFQIIKSSQVNAFAVPGGYVYFYTSIFKQFKNEAELMGVLSHEIGHIVLHHSREAMLENALGSAVIDAVLGDGNLAGTLGDLGWGLANLGSSRENEFEADSMGIYLTNKAKVRANGIESFFGAGVNLTYASDGSIASCEEDESRLVEVFSTHPASCKRIRAAHARFQALSDTEKQYSDGADTYKKMLQATSF